MFKKKLALGGVAVMIAGALLIGLAVQNSRAAFAGIQTCGTSSPTATPESTPIITSESVQQPPTCSPTPTVRIKTNTPTTTATAPATQTPAPTNTAVPTRPAVPTQPGGGNEGARITPPNTGAGDSGRGSTNLWLIIAGAAALAAGGGAVLAGMRKRG